MKRRDFLASSVAASALGGLGPAETAPGTPPDATLRPEYYQLRVHHLRRGPQQQRMDDFLREAAIPALNRAGRRPIGVFNVMIGPENPSVYVLIPYPTLDSIMITAERLAADQEYLERGASFLNAPATTPAFERVDVELMVAFEGFPRLEVPLGAPHRLSRIFELRTYESHSEKANATKIRMFNEGEIAIFRRTGLHPVFFGKKLVGSRMPNLTYMLAFESMEERDKNWSVFVADPEWKKLSATPGYTDAEIVSSISNIFLSPTPYSQI